MRTRAQRVFLGILALLVGLSIACGIAFNAPQQPVPPTGGAAPSFGQPEGAPSREGPTPTVAVGAAGEDATARRAPVLEVAPSVALDPVEEQLVRVYEEANPGVVSIIVQGRRGSGAGSGFIIDDQGHIVTNSHVVLGAQEVIVTFYNGIQARAEIVGTDLDSDLAVIRVESLPEGTHALPLADSDTVRVGQRAIAIGNPFGEEGTMTAGIVSYVGRTIESLAPQFAIPLAIQTDAPINPGNSGGPLLNSAGQVIGVNSQIESRVGANVGIGFAVPSNIVRRVVPVLITEGDYQWPWLGISGTDVNLPLAEAAGLPVTQGAYVVEVVPGAPAERAGLRGARLVTRDGLEIPVGGDVIVGADGEPILRWDDLLAHVALKQAGEVINLTVLRDGEEISVPVELAARPENLQPDLQTIP